MKINLDSLNEFIAKVTDGTGREYDGFYNNINEEYTLIYTKDNEDYKISKKSADIKDDLFDPFTQLKLIHNSGS